MAEEQDGETTFPPSQIHQKIICMLRNFCKTTSKCWWRTPGTQKGSLFSLKGGRTKYKRQRETKELETQTCPGEGVVKKEKFQHSRKSSHRWVCGEFWNLRGQHDQEKRKQKQKQKTPQNMDLTATASREVAQTLASATNKWGLDRKTWVA